MMKRLATLALAASALAVAPAAAQEHPLLELARSDLKTQKVALTTGAMQLSDSQSAVFWPIYREYDVELTKIGDQRIALLRDYADHMAQMTDPLAKDLASRALDQEAGITKLKQKYFDRMAKALSPVVAARWLQVEGQILALVQLQIAEQVPLIHKP